MLEFTARSTMRHRGAPLAPKGGCAASAKHRDLDFLACALDDPPHVSGQRCADQCSSGQRQSSDFF